MKYALGCATISFALIHQTYFSIGGTKIPDKTQPEDAVSAPSGGTAIDSSEIDSSVQAPTVVPAGKFREKQGRWPTSSYLPGYNSSVASRACPKCGFEAFAWAQTCRCGTKLTD